jgi:hypothetical protein
VRALRVERGQDVGESAPHLGTGGDRSGLHRVPGLPERVHRDDRASPRERLNVPVPGQRVADRPGEQHHRVAGGTGPVDAHGAGAGLDVRGARTSRGLRRW